MRVTESGMTSNIETLTTLPLLKELDDGARLRLAPHILHRTRSAGELILLEGEPCEAIYFVARGLVRLRQFSQEGRTHVLAYLGPGESLNLAACLDGGLNMATVDAWTDVELAAIPTRQFEALLREYPALSVSVARQLAAEVRRLSAMAKELALHPVSSRLARFLLSNAEEDYPRRLWTQDAIAANIGTVRDVVGRLLRAFAEEGLIRRERGRMVVVDRAGLERKAQGE
ncbi:MAG: Crp/Fnr family transcriptional regulator [Chloroflexi bacterium]|jgi:CRP/FNR family cyclic AMP-dependent transcriptional regulator|nr:Crp/Fnr family transcriptional regulator [Chloroflexota bacterium]